MKVLVCIAAFWMVLAASLAIETPVSPTIAPIEHPQVTRSDAPTESLNKSEPSGKPDTPMSAAPNGLQQICRVELYRCVDECRPTNVDCFPQCCRTVEYFNPLCDHEFFVEYCPSPLGNHNVSEAQSPPKADTVTHTTTDTPVESVASGPNEIAGFSDAIAGDSIVDRSAIPPDHPGQRIGQCVGQYTVCFAKCTSTHEKDCDHVCACKVIAELGDFCRSAGYWC